MSLVGLCMNCVFSERFFFVHHHHLYHHLSIFFCIVDPLFKFTIIVGDSFLFYVCHVLIRSLLILSFLAERSTSAAVLLVVILQLWSLLLNPSGPLMVQKLDFLLEVIKHVIMLAINEVFIIKARFICPPNPLFLLVVDSALSISVKLLFLMFYSVRHVFFPPYF